MAQRGSQVIREPIRTGFPVTGVAAVFRVATMSWRDPGRGWLELDWTARGIGSQPGSS
jgi:hypothetical protein